MVTEESAPEERPTPSSGKGGGVIRGSVASTTSTSSLLEAVAEQVVSEQQVVQLGQEQVVVVTEPAAGGQGGGQQILIADGQLAPGTQVIQLQGGNGQQFVMRNLKSEPEDLSVQQQQQQQPTSRTINLEAGAQAIQASAAAAVQNVIRSLKDSDKMMLQQILPNHMLAQVPRGEQSIVIVEGAGGEGSDSDMVAAEVTPTKRQRSSAGSEQAPRLQIAKQYTPFGFHCILEAPTAQWVRKDEDRCTYLNKVIGHPTLVNVQISKKNLIDLFAGSVLWGNT